MDSMCAPPQVGSHLDAMDLDMHMEEAFPGLDRQPEPETSDPDNRVDEASPEVDRRPDEVTLEVDNRAAEATLEARLSYPGLEVLNVENGLGVANPLGPFSPASTASPSGSSSPERTASPDPSEKPCYTPPPRPWWKRLWFLLVIIALVLSAAVTGTVAGVLLRSGSGTADGNRNNRNTTGNSNPEPTSTFSSSAAPSATATWPSSPFQTPLLPVIIGNAQRNSTEGPYFAAIGFLQDEQRFTPCNYTIMLEPGKDKNPCGIAMTLADGLEYIWNGCGGPTYVTWLNPLSENIEFQFYANCTENTKAWRCGDTIVNSVYRCEKPSTGTGGP